MISPGDKFQMAGDWSRYLQAPTSCGETTAIAVRGVLVAHQPHPLDGTAGEVAVSHWPSGLRLAILRSLEAAERLMDALSAYDFAALDVGYTRRGDIRIANRRRHPWLKDAKALVEAMKATGEAR